MPLIIESYEFPYTMISDVLFPEMKFQFLPKPVADLDDEKFYYTRNIDDFKAVKYYFNRIYYIENNRIVGINKIQQKLCLYEMNGKLIKFRDTIKKEKVMDKSEFLPHLLAHNGELVIFPEDDEDEDD